MKILIVEDDCIQSLNLKLQLNQLGFTDVTLCHNIDSVIYETSNTMFDLIFCDIKMPDVDGITLLSEYFHKYHESGVIIISSVDDNIREITRGMCNQLGFSYVRQIPKPLKKEKLEIEIERFLLLHDSKNTINSGVIISDEEIKKSFYNNSLFCLYQPQFCFYTGKLVGVEALIRLQHPVYGELAPSDFLSKMQEFNLMAELYLFVLNKATMAIGSMCNTTQLSLNINKELLDWELFDETVRICNKTNFPLDRLTLELTEEQAYNSTVKAMQNLAKLSLYGVKFSIDDFGTGYSSLEQLIDLPINELKIDKSFIYGCEKDYKKRQLTIASLRLAQSLGLTCVAEGVEDLATWEFVKSIGMDVCQGYYTGRPMNINDCIVFNRLAKQAEPDTAQCKDRESLLYFDTQRVRAQAAVKLLSKDLSCDDIYMANNLDELIVLYRDYPISIAIVYSEGMNEKEINELKNQVINNNVIILGESFDLFDSTKILKEYKHDNDIHYMMSNVSDFILNVYRPRINSNQPTLSVREKEVAKLLIAGFSNKYIAYELGISQKTVSTFKTRIFFKLGVKSLIDLSKALT